MVARGYSGKRWAPVWHPHSAQANEILYTLTIVVSTHSIFAMFRNLEHFTEMSTVSRDQIVEGQPIKVLATLVCLFYDLALPLLQCCDAQLFPALGRVNLCGAFRRHFDVAALQR